MALGLGSHGGESVLSLSATSTQHQYRRHAGTSMYCSVWGFEESACHEWGSGPHLEGIGISFKLAFWHVKGRRARVCVCVYAFCWASVGEAVLYEAEAGADQSTERRRERQSDWCKKDFLAGRQLSPSGLITILWQYSERVMHTSSSTELGYCCMNVWQRGSKYTIVRIL